jgi:hypothetical protein
MFLAAPATCLNRSCSDVAFSKASKPSSSHAFIGVLPGCSCDDLYGHQVHMMCCRTESVKSNSRQTAFVSIKSLKLVEERIADVTDIKPKLKQ